MKKNIARSKEAVPDAAIFFTRFPDGGFRWDIYGQNGNDSGALVSQLTDYVKGNNLTVEQCRALLLNIDGLDGAYAEGYTDTLLAVYQKEEAVYTQAWQSLTSDQQQAVPRDVDGLLPRSAAIYTTGGAAFPLSEKAVTTALNDVGLPLTISSEETQSFTEGQIAYTLRSGGEDRFPWGGVSSAVYGGGKRFCQVTHLEAAGEDITFHWEDWQKTITLAGKLWGGFDDDDQLYRQLSDLNIPDDTVTGASWETETGGGFCRVSYSVTMIQSKPSHVNFTIVFYESRQEYCQMMKEAMQNREANRIDQLVLMGQAKQGN